MIQQAPVVIEGVRLRLRRATPADAAATFRAAQDAEVMRYMDWPMNRAESDARAYLDGCAQRWDAGTEYHWVLERKPEAAVIGAISCRPRGHSVDFGYFLGREHWGQGLASEGVGLLVGWLRRQPGIVRIWATTDCDNQRSAAALRRAGLTLEGVMRKATIRPNLDSAPRDTALYAWVREAPADGAAP